MKFKSVDEILDLAIRKEEEAAEMYANLAQTTKRPHMRRVFEDFAREERGHKAKLLEIKTGKVLIPVADKVMDLKIAEYVSAVAPSPDLDYQQALILAMKEEKAAFKLYSGLVETTNNPDLRTTLLALAQEEARHKLRFEIEYDDYVLTED